MISLFCRNINSNNFLLCFVYVSIQRPHFELQEKFLLQKDTKTMNYTLHFYVQDKTLLWKCQSEEFSSVKYKTCILIH